MSWLRNAKSSAGWAVLCSGAAIVGVRALVGCSGGAAHVDVTGVYQPMGATDLASATDIKARLPDSATIHYVSIRKGRSIPTPATVDFTLDIRRDRGDDTRALSANVGALGVASLSTRFTGDGRPAQEWIANDDAPLHDVLAAIPPGKLSGLSVGATWESEPPADELRAMWDLAGTWAMDEEQSFHVESAWEDPARHYVVARISSKIFRSTVDTRALRELNDLRQRRGDDPMPSGRTALMGVSLNDVAFARAGAKFQGALVLRSVALYAGEDAAMDAEISFDDLAAKPDTLSVAFCATAAPADIALDIPQPTSPAFVAGCSRDATPTSGGQP